MRSTRLALLALPALVALLAACGDDDGGNQNLNQNAPDAAPGTDAIPPPDAGPGTDAGPGADATTPPPTGCDPLPAPTGPVIEVFPADADTLRATVMGAASGTTILLHDGTYALDGGDDAHRLSFYVDGVTLRSASGNREAVILDGGYVTGEVVSIAASDVTIAHLTITRAYYHPIHVTGGAAGDTHGTLIHDVRVIDPGEQGIKINPSAELTYADQGVISCSHLELTDAGRPQIRNSCYTGGIDGHAAWGWQIRRNTIVGFWCDTGLSEHGIHLWRTCRDSVVEENRILDCARGIGFGMGETGTDTDRVYPDDPYPTVGYLGHIDGVIRNNFVWADLPGFDSGINLDQAHGTVIAHNTVVAVQTPFNCIEWRFDNAAVTLLNNLVSHNLMDRGGTAVLEGNVENAPLAWFVDGAAGDLHLAAGAAGAIDQGVAVDPGVCDGDIDGEARTGARDVGADEREP